MFHYVLLFLLLVLVFLPLCLISYKTAHFYTCSPTGENGACYPANAAITNKKRIRFRDQFVNQTRVAFLQFETATL